MVIAACINYKKRFTSMRAISMHLKTTASRHIVNFINYGNCYKRAGLISAYLEEPHAKVPNSEIEACVVLPMNILRILIR
jgi:hypothetical protein